MSEKKLVFRCCFCGQWIYGDVCAITLYTGWGTDHEGPDQIFWCHLACLSERMDKALASEIVVGR